MERIDFRIEFQEIGFKVKSRRPFSVSLIVQSADGQELRSEQALIVPQDGPVSLTEIVPLELFLVVEERNCYLPFEIWFVVNKAPSIKRRVPLHLLSIYDHHTQNEKTPLARVYAFEDGNIIYNVKITGSSLIMGSAEAQRYKERLGCSSVSNSIIKEPTAQQVHRTKSRPSFSISDISDKNWAQETLNLDGDADEIEQGLSQVESWQKFEEMQNEYNQDKPIKQKQPIRKIGNAFMLIAVLIFIGIFLLSVSSIRQTSIKMKDNRNMEKDYDKIKKKKRKDKYRQSRQL